jgi:hypothetical protein
MLPCGVGVLFLIALEYTRECNAVKKRRKRLVRQSDNVGSTASDEGLKEEEVGWLRSTKHLLVRDVQDKTENNRME